VITPDSTKPDSPSLARERVELLALAGHYKSIVGAVTAVLAAFPFGALALGLLFAPDQEIVTPIIAGLFSLLMLLLLYYVFRDASPSLVWSWGVALVPIGLTLLLVYMGFWFALVRQVEDRKQLLGFSLTDGANAAVRNRTAASDSPRDLLRCFGYESADRIWKGRTAAKIVLFALFVIGCACATGGFFLLTLRNFLVDRDAKLAIDGTVLTQAAVRARSDHAD
jgi:hypothetical protein